MTRVLLWCGIAYAVFYIVVNDVVAATAYDGYSRLDQAISELSARGAPTQTFLRWTVPVDVALPLSFGVGVWRSAAGRRGVRWLAGLVVVFALSGIAWLWFPMSDRDDIAAGVGDSTNDTGHLVLSGLSVTLIVACTVVAAVLWRGWFRWYTAVTLAAVLATGSLASRMVPRIEDGEDTSWLGAAERVSVYGFDVWLAVLAGFLLWSGALSRPRASRPLRPMRQVAPRAG